MRLKKNKFVLWLTGSSSNSLFWAYIVMYALAALELIFYIAACPDGIHTPDTFTYISASYTIPDGMLHEQRTPLYPLVIACMRALFGESRQLLLTNVMQCVVFFISIFYFQQILRKVSIYRWLVFASTFIYALFPGFNSFCIYILTEAFTVSFVVFFIWSLVRDFPNLPKWTSALFSGLWLFLLIYLRPASLCLLPVYLIYWGYMLYKWKRKVLSSVLSATASTVVIIFSLALYKAEIHRLYSIHSISIVTIYNNYFTVREANSLRSTHTDHPGFKQYLETVQDSTIFANDGRVKYNEFRYLRDSLHVDSKTFETAVNKALSSHLDPRISRIPSRLYRASIMPLFIWPQVPYINIVDMAFRLTMYSYMLFLLGSIIWILARKKGICEWTLWLTSTSFLATSIVGAMAEWNRLTLPGMSAALILLTIMINSLYVRCRKRPIQAAEPI